MLVTLQATCPWYCELSMITSMVIFPPSQPMYVNTLFLKAVVHTFQNGDMYIHQHGQIDKTSISSHLDKVGIGEIKDEIKRKKLHVLEHISLCLHVLLEQHVKTITNILRNGKIFTSYTFSYFPLVHLNYQVYQTCIESAASQIVICSLISLKCSQLFSYSNNGLTTSFCTHAIYAFLDSIHSNNVGREKPKRLPLDLCCTSAEYPFNRNSLTGMGSEIGRSLSGQRPVLATRRISPEWQLALSPGDTTTPTSTGSPFRRCASGLYTTQYASSFWIGPKRN